MGEWMRYAGRERRLCTAAKATCLCTNIVRCVSSHGLCRTEICKQAHVSLLRIAPTNPYKFFSQFYCFSNTIHIPATYSHILAYVQPSPTTLLRIYRPRTKHTRSLTRPYSFVSSAAVASSSNNITTYTIHQSFATLSVASAPVNNDIFAKTPKGFHNPRILARIHPFPGSPESQLARNRNIPGCTAAPPNIIINYDTD